MPASMSLKAASLTKCVHHRRKCDISDKHGEIKLTCSKQSAFLIAFETLADETRGIPQVDAYPQEEKHE